MLGFTVQSVFGAVVPSATPPEIVNKLSADLSEAVNSPEIKARMAEIALTPVGNKPEEFNAFMRKEIDRWAKAGPRR